MRKKRLMALLLSGVMAATMFSVPVFAEEADTETATAVSYTHLIKKKCRKFI